MGQQPEPPKDKCPDCLVMDLEIVPSHSSSPEKERLDLYLTIQFNEQWEQLPLHSGRVKFGLKGGELRLKLENSKMPLVSRELSKAFELSLEKEIQQQESNEDASELETVIANGKYEAKAKLGEKIGTKKTERFKVTSCQVTTKGSEENPAWAFEVKNGEPVLKGLLKEAKLGTLDVTQKPCSLIATFEVSKRDVYLTDATGILSPEVSREKRAVLDRKLALIFLERKLSPYLSRVEKQYPIQAA